MYWNGIFLQNVYPPTIQCPSLNRCPRAQNYWKNTQRWPVTGLVLGNLFASYPYPSATTYSNHQARIILSTPDGTDESIVLAHQLIAAKLNLFNGTPRIVNTGLPNGIEAIFLVTTDADRLLGSFNNVNSIPQHVNPSSIVGQKMAVDAATLKSYNTGAFTPQLPDGTCHDAS